MRRINLSAGSQFYIPVYGFLLILSVLACSSETVIEETAFNLPEEPTHELREIFRINEPVQGAFFNVILKIHILSNGNVIAQNYRDQKLYELTPEGGLVNLIGREGRGPGEFVDIHTSLVAPGDSLHVFDYSNARHQVFVQNEEHIWEYSRESSFRFQLQTELKRQLPEVVTVGLDSNLMGVFKVDRQYLSPGSVIQDTISNNYKYIAQVDENMEHSGEPIRMKLVDDLAIYRRNDITGTSNNKRLLHAYYNYNPSSDEVIYVTNTSNEIVSIDSSGNEIVKGYLPFDRFPVNREEIDESADLMESRVPGMGNYLRQQFLVHEPYYWNAVLVDDKLWVELARSDAEKPNWVITSLEGEIEASFHGPTDLIYLAVQGNRMYSSVLDSSDINYLVGYELTESGE